MLLRGLLAGPSSLDLEFFFVAQFDILGISSRNDLVVLHFVIETDEFHSNSIFVFVSHVLTKQTLLLSLVQLTEDDTNDSESRRLFHQVLLLKDCLRRVALVVLQDFLDISQVLAIQVFQHGLVGKLVIFVNVKSLLRILSIMLEQ